MQQITIAERLKPYSHVPGTPCILPGSTYQVQIFPALIRICDATQAPPLLLNELALSVAGPVKEFTVLVDLERGRICVWGHTATGFMRYRLTSQAQGKGIRLDIEKAPQSGLSIRSHNSTHTLQAKDGIAIESQVLLDPFEPPHTDRLSLGNHKAQDWDLIKRRLDLKEILPLWYRLGQLVPQQPIQKGESKGILVLMHQCEEAVVHRKTEAIVPVFTSFFQAGFHGLLAPHLWDDSYQGLISDERPDISPVGLLTQSVDLIRRLFVQQEHQTISILPVLPPEFHCGRLVHIPFQQGYLDLEWSKKIIRRMGVYVYQDQTLLFQFKKQLKSFRLRQTKGDKGERVSCHSTLSFKKNCYYFFDNFE